MTLGSHQQCVGKSQDWITPAWIIAAVGPFDLDPCAADPRPWDCARVNWSTHGLERDWFGTIYLNPPYSRYEVSAWVSKLARHNNGVALLHARTETEWFKPVWQHAAVILFLADRIHFHRPNGTREAANSGAPPVLAAFGDEAAQRLYRCGIGGALVTRWHNQPSTIQWCAP
jgi:DNA N-6-adenine-methyltransferase (Dam)